MKEIRKTSQFKKDYKRFKNDKEFIATLMRIVKLLAEGNQIPEEYNPQLARRMYKMLPAEMQSAIDSNEALIISLSHLPRNSKQSALARNKYIISIADNVVFGALDPTSSLTNLVEEQKLPGIEIHASV